MNVKRWYYRGGRPNRVARVLDRGTAALYALGISPDYLVTLEVPGRRTGTPRYATIFPIEVNGVRYLVSQYGATDWVNNLRSAGSAKLHRKGRTETVSAREVDGTERTSVLAAYGAKLRGPEGGDFRALPNAADHPTFRVESTG